MSSVEPSQAKKPRSLWWWEAGAFALFEAVIWIHEWLGPTTPPKPYQPPPAPAVSTEHVVDCNRPGIDPDVWDFFCGPNDGSVEPEEPADGPLHRYG